MEAFLSAVRRAMNDKEWSVYRLAAESGTNYDSISRWLTGRGNVNMDTLRKICLSLGIKVEVTVPEAANHGD